MNNECNWIALVVFIFLLDFFPKPCYNNVGSKKVKCIEEADINNDLWLL